MASHEQDPSTQGLLGSTSEHHSSGSDSDDNINTHLTNNDVPKYSNRKKKQPHRRPKPTNRTPSFQPLPTHKSFLARRSRCCLLLTSFGLIIFVILLIGGGLGYKVVIQEPPYGLSPPWYPSPLGGTSASWSQSYAKASALVRNMTLAEKVNITTGVGWQMGLSLGTTGPASLVGFPALQLQDGPLGIRSADNITAFPAGITVGATWNRQLMFARGKAHAIEARNKGVNAVLGPCVGPLGRMPAGGRNWEGFGADPYLQGVAGAETIKGIQSEGIMATIKHFVANEQEHFRQAWEWGLPNALSSNVDDRTLHELYGWPFGDAVKAGVVAVMCSYNMVNNSYACGNSKLLNGILKDELGFQGFVVSDWLAQRSGVGTALAGLDMTMPGDGLRWADGKSLWGKELSKAVLNGSVPLERMNDMVTRVVAAWYQMGQDQWSDHKGPNFSSWTDEKMGVTSPGSPTDQEKVVVNQFVDVMANHSVIARQIAAEGTVLLKNENDILPLTRSGLRRKRENTIDKVKIGIFGEDAGPIPDAPKNPNACKDRGCNKGTLASGWGSGAVEFPYLVTPIDALLREFDSSKVHLHSYLTNSLPLATSASEKQVLADLDLCLVFVNADSGEGFTSWSNVRGDRPDLFLQKGGDQLIQEVAAQCGGGFGDVVVVIHSVGPVVMEGWIELPQVKAVLFANLPGEESGNALVDVLFGDINPSGHLPFTIGKRLEDYGEGGKVMYLPNGVVPQQDFKEGVYVDYRWFDKKGIEPRYEFGFGLSYTSFELGNATVKTVKDRSALPAPRPEPAAEPPRYSTDLLSPEEVIWPKEEGVIRKLEKYIYPYLSSSEAQDAVSARQKGEKYPYPEGYNVSQPLSQAGGDEGGNPDLWEVYATVAVDVTNTGSRAGAAVPQLYLSYPESVQQSAEGEGGGAETTKAVDFPVKVLRGFDKLYLESGETQKVEFNLTRRDLSYWDVEVQNWRVVVEGEYTFRVGQSSRDLPVEVRW